MEDLVAHLRRSAVLAYHKYLTTPVCSIIVTLPGCKLADKISRCDLKIHPGDSSAETLELRLGY